MAAYRNTLLKYQNITSGDMSASITSAVTNILNLDNIGIEVTWSGTSPTGTVTVEVSIDYAQDQFGNVTNSGTWVALNISSSVSGNTGSVFFDLNQLSAPWIRAKYTRSGGTGTMQAYICGKGI